MKYMRYKQSSSGRGDFLFIVFVSSISISNLIMNLIILLIHF